MDLSGQLYAPSDLPPGKKPPGTRWIGSCVGLRADLYTVARRKKYPYPCRGSNPGRPARSL